MEIFVLVNGEKSGPFEESELLAKVEAGELSENDLVLIEGMQEWTPLGSIIVREQKPRSFGESVDACGQASREFVGRLRFKFREKPFTTGILFFLVGCLVMFLSQWPALFYAPLFILALFGVWPLVHRQRFFLAVCYLVLTVAGPIFLWDRIFKPENSLVSKSIALASSLPELHTAQKPKDAPSPAVVSEKQEKPVKATDAPPEQPAPLEVQKILLPPATVSVADTPGSAQIEKASQSASATTPSVTLNPYPTPTPAAQAPTASNSNTPPNSSQTPSIGLTGMQRHAQFLREQADRIEGLYKGPTAYPFVPQTSGTASVAQPVNAKDAETVQKSRDSLVFVEGQDKLGSAFICRLKGRPTLVTNIHVLSGNKSPTFNLLDGSPIKVGQASAAVGHDIMAFSITSGGTPLEAMEEVEKNAAIGDPVLVLGNAEGARVINLIQGKIVGIGPDLVEVDAEFLPGNSGSPIIHKNTGKVIGVATYVITRVVKSATVKKTTSRAGNQPDTETKVRRFGYRIDSVKGWQPVSWPVFYSEDEQFGKVQTLTSDLLKLCKNIEDDGHITYGAHQNSAIRQPIDDYVRSMERGHISPADLAHTKQSLLSSIRSACQSDITQAKNKLTFDYFQRKLVDEQHVRDEFAEYFDSLIKLQNPDVTHAKRTGVHIPYIPPQNQGNQQDAPLR